MNRRNAILSWLMAGLEAVEPRALTASALHGESGPLTVIAIGKAAPAMCWGVLDAVGRVDGLCVTNHDAIVPDGVELLVGDHPVPGEASLHAGLRALEVAPAAGLALLSGGGSALCEVPSVGLDLDLVAEVNRRMLDAGTSIEETNLVRSHISRIKGGGLGALPTLILSDVGRAGPEVVSSGPTIVTEHDPQRVIGILKTVGVAVDRALEEVVRRVAPADRSDQRIEVIGDGKVAARAIAAAASSETTATVAADWVSGPYLNALEGLIIDAPPGVTVAAGEPSVPVVTGGVGGRNTHTALAAARMIAGTEIWFAALATDGDDGNSSSAGAIVSGTTIDRGGIADEALDAFDSATYLKRTGDLIETGPTGTNVADVWLVWKPEDDPQPILAS